MLNQTEELWLVGCTPKDKGIGLYLADSQFISPPGRSILSLNSGSNLYDKFLIEQITYPEAVEFGNLPGIHVLKWFPPMVATRQELQNAPPCDGTVLCVDRCARLGCACKDGRCY